MEIFKLIPTQPGVQNKKVVIRAKTAERAKEIAMEATRLTVDRRVSTKQDSPGNVWTKDADETEKTGCKCEPYQGNNYEKNGVEEILEPKSLQDDWQKIKKLKN